MSTPRELRELCRVGRFTDPTAGICGGYVQANLVILPAIYAQDFRRFCELNPKPCPLLDELAPGSVESTYLAPGSDVRTDLPKYRVCRNGLLVEEPTDIRHVWQDDLVTFFLGCSFSFEEALTNAGYTVRHLEEGVNKCVPMYKTSVQCVSSGPFKGPLVVSMRPYRESDVAAVCQITGNYPRVHGSPVHWGDPGKLGITQLDQPDCGDAVRIGKDEVPVFWACGVTPQAVALESKLPLMIAHAPGHMFVADRLNADFEEKQ